METFGWQQVGDEYHAETDVGIAIIAEHRREPSPWLAAKQLFEYTARIESPSGAILDPGTSAFGALSFRDFTETAQFLRYHLAGLARRAHGRK